MSMHTVAVMGLGVRGKIHLHGLLENPDYYKVVGLCDIDEPKMKAVAEEYHLDDVPLFTDAEEMLKETRPEIFVFVTYPDRSARNPEPRPLDTTVFEGQPRFRFTSS